MECFEELSERHRHCLQMVADGIDIQAIAMEIDSSPEVVQEILTDCQRVLSTRDDGHSVAVALRKNIIA